MEVHKNDTFHHNNIINEDYCEISYISLVQIIFSAIIDTLRLNPYLPFCKIQKSNMYRKIFQFSADSYLENLANLVKFLSPDF